MKPKYDTTKADEIMNKHVIIGITKLDKEDVIIERIQMHGNIIRVDPNKGVTILLEPSKEEYVLPPDLSAFHEAPPGEYRFTSTGEIVVNPDYMTTWTISAPKSENE
jgi:hypothetical protein